VRPLSKVGVVVAAYVLAFLLTGCLAPKRIFRIIFLISTAIEAAVFAFYLIIQE
jgi:hypothetical protein